MLGFAVATGKACTLPAVHLVDVRLRARMTCHTTPHTINQRHAPPHPHSPSASRTTTPHHTTPRTTTPHHTTQRYTAARVIPSHRDIRH